MGKSQNKISYFNTLMFTIFTGIVSLGVLSFLFFDFGKKFIYFIIAFEVGVFMLIAYCLYKIISGDKKINAKDKYVVRFDECPDYYSKKIIEGKEYCFNEYVVKDNAGNVKVIKITPAEIGGVKQDPDSAITLTDIVEPNAKLYAKFELHKLENDDNIPTYEEKCKYLFKQPPVDEKYNSYRQFTYIPYTYAKSRCESLAE